MSQSKDPWYMQEPPGFREYFVGEDFLFVEEKIGDSKKSTENYTSIVKAWISAWRDTGWDTDRWIAAECHGNDAGAQYQWVWLYGKQANLFEYQWCDNDPAQVDEVVSLHKGMAWRFPFIIFFDEEPVDAVKDVLRGYKVPYCVDPQWEDFPSDDDDSDDPPPPPPGDKQAEWDDINEINKYRDRLETKVNFLARWLLGVV